MFIKYSLLHELQYWVLIINTIIISGRYLYSLCIRRYNLTLCIRVCHAKYIVNHIIFLNFWLSQTIDRRVKYLERSCMFLEKSKHACGWFRFHTPIFSVGLNICGPLDRENVGYHRKLFPNKSIFNQLIVKLTSFIYNQLILINN